MMHKSLPPLDAAWDPTLQTDDEEEYCWTPLQLAARGGELENIREILAANPKAVNDPPHGYYGQTAIQAACMHGHEQAVQMLVDAGADIHFCGGNNFQRNALQIACGHGNEKVVDILLSAGAKATKTGHRKPVAFAQKSIRITPRCISLPLRVSDPTKFTPKLAARSVLEVTAQRPPETAAGATRKTLPVVNHESPPLPQALNVERQRLFRYKSDLVDLKPLNLQDLAEM
ncbi:hypothetical protein K4K57_005689 [Colletotrichum sp. SAR 10_99]|nr:hypothetical protein K4K57_005689 [Colletotrichum sp. SAR 10_99]